MVRRDSRKPKAVTVTSGVSTRVSPAASLRTALLALSLENVGGMGRGGGGRRIAIGVTSFPWCAVDSSAGVLQAPLATRPSA